MKARIYFREINEDDITIKSCATRDWDDFVNSISEV